MQHTTSITNTLTLNQPVHESNIRVLSARSHMQYPQSPSQPKTKPIPLTLGLTLNSKRLSFHRNKCARTCRNNGRPVATPAETGAAPPHDKVPPRRTALQPRQPPLSHPIHLPPHPPSQAPNPIPFAITTPATLLRRLQHLRP